MKKLTLSTIFLICILFSNAQTKQHKRIIPHYLATTPAQNTELVHLKAGAHMASPTPGQRTPTTHAFGKTQNIQAIQLGSASNVFTVLRSSSNAVSVIDSLGIVAFIHRQDVATHGGDNGSLRYDYSLDGGNTFTLDVGPLNSSLNLSARYPQMTAFHPTTDQNPYNTQLAWAGATLRPNPVEWAGQVNGLSNFGINPPTTTENYQFQTGPTLIPGGLCEGAPGIFWNVESSWDGNEYMDSVYLYKGVHDPVANKVDWAKAQVFAPAHNLQVDGFPQVVAPNVAFAPDGQIGYVAFLGDLIGGIDSVNAPIFIKTTDGGDTWGAPVEIDLRQVSWMEDSLKSLWVDANGDPASTGLPAMSYEFDLSVDMNGNPHLFGVVGSGSTTESGPPSFSFYYGLWKGAIDVHSTDGGLTWDAELISPVLTMQGPVIASDPSITVIIDNYPQLSRSLDGSHLFYSWVDTDTCEYGFGSSQNFVPDLMTAAKRVTDNYRSDVHTRTGDDFIWAGKAYFPTVSPLALEDQNGNFKVPTVIAEMIFGDALNTTDFHYIGNDILYFPSNFKAPETVDLSHGDCFITGIPGLADPRQLNLLPCYPNPHAGLTTIAFELAQPAPLTLTISNLQGQIIRTVAEGQYPGGKHEIVIDITQMASGMYFYTLESEGVQKTRKMNLIK